MILGITGGVGCGKSTVLNVLKEKYNCFIIDADKVAHRLMEPKKEAYNLIVDYFGEAILNADKTINRTALGQIVFNDSAKLKKLNSFVHPEVKKDIISQIEDIKSKNNNALIALEAALLIEAGYMDICDEMWYIYTENEIRIDRLMKTRGYTYEKAQGIINNQLKDSEFRKYCDKIIDNSKAVNDTVKQIKSALKR